MTFSYQLYINKNNLMARRMLGAAIAAFPIITRAVKLVVDFIDQTDVMEKKLDGTWVGKIDGPRVAKEALKRGKEIMDYLVSTKQIEEEQKPSDEVLHTLIEAQVSSDKKENRQVMKRATHEEIMKLVETAVKSTRFEFVVPKVESEGIDSYERTGKKEGVDICKQKVRHLLKSHSVYLGDEALNIYIGAMSDQLSPSVRLD